MKNRSGIRNCGILISKFETEIDEVKNVVTVSKIMQWFKGDFGGNDGITKILSKYLLKDFSPYTIRYKNMIGMNT